MNAEATNNENPIDSTTVGSVGIASRVENPQQATSDRMENPKTATEVDNTHYKNGGVELTPGCQTSWHYANTLVL